MILDDPVGLYHIADENHHQVVEYVAVTDLKLNFLKYFSF